MYTLCLKNNPLCCWAGADYYLVSHGPILIILADIFLKDVDLKQCFQFPPYLTFVSTLPVKNKREILTHFCISFPKIHFST